MPTYTYRCATCSHHFDIFQKFSDDPLTECPECGGLVRKVFQPVGIVFKGSGWYVTDSRKGEATANGSGDKAKAPASESKPDAATTSTEPAAPATPAAPAKAAAD